MHSCGGKVCHAYVQLYIVYVFEYTVPIHYLALFPCTFISDAPRGSGGSGPSKPEPWRGVSGKHLQGYINRIFLCLLFRYSNTIVPLGLLYGFLKFEQAVLICKGGRRI